MNVNKVIVVEHAGITLSLKLEEARELIVKLIDAVDDKSRDVGFLAAMVKTQAELCRENEQLQQECKRLSATQPSEVTHD